MNSRLVSYVALVASIVSICYAAWLHQRTEAIVKTALQQRETELARSLAPWFHEYYVGFGIAESDIPQSPSTLEELFRPFKKVSEIASPRIKP
jgi:hypothetical protein